MSSFKPSLQIGCGKALLSLTVGSMADPLRIVADTPTAQPGLGFPQYVAALADAIRGGEPPQFTIGLYGSWGSGKSSLLAALYESLASPDSNVLPVLFDAWRYERSEFIVVPLLHAVHARALEVGHRALAKTIRRALESIISSVTFSFSGFTIDPKAGQQAWDESNLTALDDAFSRPFSELREVPEALQGMRVAVLIDDLDRCSAGHVVELLEAINLIMDVHGFIFVMALDYEVIVSAVQERYPHASGHAFIQKIVQLPFRVPPLEISTKDFPDLVPDWEKWASRMPEAFERFAVEISVMALRGNPRQIKRFLNSFLFIHRIIQSRRLRVDYELLAAIIGLQLAWPDNFRVLQEDLAAAGEDPTSTPRNNAQREEDQWLGRYYIRFFAKKSAAQLRTLMQLTAVVAAPETPTLPPLAGPAEEIRESNRSKVIEALKELGYAPSEHSERYWYNPKHRDWRFVLLKHNVNLQKRQSGAWGNWRGYLLTREADQAISAARAPLRVKRG